MATVRLSDAEKTFVLHGVREDLRVDGRTRNQIRSVSYVGAPKPIDRGETDERFYTGPC